jgi:thiamine biosynthesis protein ThiI
MTLTKVNYYQFQKQINSNIRNKLKRFKKLQFENTSFRFYIYLNGEDYREVLEELDTVVGLSSYSLCKKVRPEYDEISKTAIEMIREMPLPAAFTFKVETHRGDKSYPATSIEISQEVAKRMLPQISGMKTDVHHPSVTLFIDLRAEGTYIFVDTRQGLGGYPSGIAGSGLLMISGGIDSPVAGFLSLRKGINLTAVHFASPPYTSDMALQKVIDLLQELSRYATAGKIKLLVVPFTKIQETIHNHADSAYLITIMRRQMYKIAVRICEKRKIDVIINGESIGQVASQTLESIRAVNEVTNIPIIRPLATFDKEEIITVARKIRTFDISIRPYEDCCTVFVPEHPIIRPDLERVFSEESKCEFGFMIEDAVENIKEYNLNYSEKISIFETFRNSGNFDI